MKPHEFWHDDLTPYETSLWIEEYSKQGIVMAWNIAALNRMGKTNKFPQSPLPLIGDQRRLRKISDADSVANVRRFFEKQQKAAGNVRKDAPAAKGERQ
jgi:hypothetical protein